MDWQTQGPARNPDFSISDDSNLSFSVADLLFLISTELGVVTNGKL